MIIKVLRVGNLTVTQRASRVEALDMGCEVRVTPFVNECVAEVADEDQMCDKLVARQLVIVENYFGQKSHRQAMMARVRCLQRFFQDPEHVGASPS